MNHQKADAAGMPAAVLGNDQCDESRRSVILGQLARIKNSRAFGTSARAKEFFSYVVEQAVDGHTENLKERAIGVGLFDRAPTYMTGEDPIVRVQAAEVRKRLAVYYTEEEQTPEVRIEIPVGSYVPVFHWSPPAQSKEPSTEIQPVTTIAPPPRFLTWKTLAIAVVLVLLGIVVAANQYFASPYERAINQFWSPILDTPNTVLISIGRNPVYVLTPTYIEAYNRQHPGSKNEGMEPYVPLPPDAKLDGRNLVLVDGNFVALSDVAATSKILSMMVLRKKQFNIRLGSDLTFGDLNEDPSVLIGGYNNSWTLSMVASQRYVFSPRADIIDRSNPQKHWSANADSTEDYAIVSRVLNSKTGKPILIAAGITGAGTRAAVGFITDPQAISALAKSLPKGWEKKNVEVVLHVSATNGVPIAPDVVATYCW